MKKNKLVVAALLSLFTLGSVNTAFAYTERNYLQKQLPESQLMEALVMNQMWVKYPAYADRAGWDKVLKGDKERIIKEGEKALCYQWQVIKATDYIEFERSGDRNIMQKPYGENANALASLFLAELAEGKGRFIDQIINGVFYYCEMSSWCYSAHFYIQPSGRALPEVNYPVIDLGAAGTSVFLSWVYYYFHNQFDKVNPEISRRLYSEIDERIMTPYLENDSYWWMAQNYHGQMINNWNPVCNSEVLLTFMLLENDKERLAKAVHRSMVSVDRYFNYVHEDGGCEEGPGYWNIAPGKALDYMQILNLITADKANIFDVPQIRKMGEYIAHSYVGNGYVVNFADASVRAGHDPFLIYRYGKAVGSDMLKQHASYVFKDKVRPKLTKDLFRSMEALAVLDELKATPAKHMAPKVSWYPETELCFMHNDNAFFAAKGGYNDESHNHNDVGTFSLWVNNTPMIIDAGVGTYTRQTFSSERYSIWTMQSNYHNVPMINGVPQKHGRKYKAMDAKVSSNRFSLNMAAAYPEQAKVDSWVRDYTFKKHELVIEDRFSLKEVTGDNQLNFLCWGDIQIHKDFVEISVKDVKHAKDAKDAKCKIHYNSKLFDATVETVKLTDPSLSRVWGDAVYRLCFKAKQRATKGSYKFSVRY